MESPQPRLAAARVRCRRGIVLVLLTLVNGAVYGRIWRAGPPKKPQAGLKSR